jgi:hypothetical protein
MKWYRHPLDLHFSHDPQRFGTGKVVGYARNGEEKLEKAFRPATKTACHRRHTEEDRPEAKEYLADAKANREMVAAGEPDGPPRRTIAVPTADDPDRRLIAD